MENEHNYAAQMNNRTSSLNEAANIIIVLNSPSSRQRNSSEDRIVRGCINSRINLRSAVGLSRENDRRIMDNAVLREADRQAAQRITDSSDGPSRARTRRSGNQNADGTRRIAPREIERRTSQRIANSSRASARNLLPATRTGNAERSFRTAIIQDTRHFFRRILTRDYSDAPASQPRDESEAVRHAGRSTSRRARTPPAVLDNSQGTSRPRTRRSQQLPENRPSARNNTNATPPSQAVEATNIPETLPRSNNNDNNSTSTRTGTFNDYFNSLNIRSSMSSLDSQRWTSNFSRVYNKFSFAPEMSYAFRADWKNVLRCFAPGRTHATQHCGTIRTFIVFFNFSFDNILDSTWLRVIRELVERTQNTPMQDVVTVHAKNGKYLIAEKTEASIEKCAYLLDTRTCCINSHLEFSIFNNRYLLTHIRRAPSQGILVEPGIWPFIPFSSTLDATTATRVQLHQFLFYQAQQEWRDTLELEQFRTRLEQRQSAAEQEQEQATDTGNAARPRPPGLTTVAQVRDYYRTFMEMNASTACFVDILQEKEYKIKMSNQNMNNIREAYLKLEHEPQLLKSDHYGHRLIRKAVDIVPYVDTELQIKYDRCFIVINPIAVTDEELYSMHGQDLSANQIDIGKNMPGCAIEDLHTYLRRRKRLHENEALNLFFQICETVRVCHRNGIVLRDLKLKRFYFIDEER